MKSNSDDTGHPVTDYIYSQVSELYKMCLEAGNVIMGIYERLQPHEVSYKSDYSPVTEADLLSNDILLSGLCNLTPEIPVISEESFIPDYSERKNYSALWLLDPLDGTQSFIRKTGEFAINMAMILEEKVVAGYIYLPTSQRMYYAVKGYGAYEYLSGEKLKVSEFQSDQKALRILQSRHHKDTETREWIKKLNEPELITVGGSLKFIHIATGKADFYPRLTHLMEWDAAAGNILIEEAGGGFTHAFKSEKIKYNSSKLLHPAFVASGKMIIA